MHLKCVSSKIVKINSPDPTRAISRATDLEKVALLLPIRPDHFINRNFIDENIKINVFYNNLNKKFNADRLYRL